MKHKIHQKLPHSWEEREKLRENGQFWTPSWVAEAMVQYVISGSNLISDTLTPSDYDVVNQPLKPFMYGHTKMGNKVVPVQNKNSEYLLTAQLASKSPKLKKIWEFLQKNPDIEFISFESVVKAGLNRTLNWDNLENYTSQEVKDNLQVLNNADYGIQQEVPVHYLDDQNLFGTQIRKLILADITPGTVFNVNGKEYTKEQLVELYQNLIIANLNEAYDNTIDRLGTIEDGQVVVDITKLSELLSQEVLDQDLGDQLLKAVQLDKNTGEFVLPLFNPLHSDRIERLLNSIFKNKVTKQKIKGGAFVQTSGVMFTEGLDIKWTPEGGLKEVQAKLPWYSKKYFEPLMDENGEIDITKVPEPLLKMVGYRIPTEDKYSMLPLKVTGFLPSNAGGSILLPWEITTIAGSDFDVDKLYVMMPEFKVNEGAIEIASKESINNLSNYNTSKYLKDYNLEKLNNKSYYSNEDSKLISSKNIDDYIKKIDKDLEQQSAGGTHAFFEYIEGIEGSGLLDQNGIRFTYQNNEILLEYDPDSYLRNTVGKFSKRPLLTAKQHRLNIRESIKALYSEVGDVNLNIPEMNNFKGKASELLNIKTDNKIEKVEFDNKKSISDNSLEARDNQLIDIMSSILTNPDTFDKFITPGGYEDLRDDINFIHNKTKADLTTLGYDPETQLTMFSNNMAGRALVGPFANHNASHAMMQYTDLELADPIIINGNEYQSLHDIYSKHGTRITNDNAQYLAASVDSAKDPLMYKGNINTYTVDVVAMLSSLGVPRREIFALIKQPIIVELVNRYYKYGATFDAENRATKELQNLFGKIDKKITNLKYNDLLKTLNDKYSTTNQGNVLETFLDHKDKASSVTKVIGSMKSETKGAGPLMATNEVTLRSQDAIVQDSNLKGMVDIFNGTKYPVFKSFNDNGLVKPNSFLKQLFPLSTDNTISSPYQIKDALTKEVGKPLTDTEINHINKAMYTFIGSKFEFYNKDEQSDIVKNFPNTYEKIRDKHVEDYKVLLYIKPVQDNKFNYKRLELHNTGMDNVVREEITDSWWNMMNNPELREVAMDLAKYAYFKEGFQFAPKSFSHLIPTEFFTSTPEGRAINEQWQLSSVDSNVGILDSQIANFTQQYLRNNWTNSKFVPEAILSGEGMNIKGSVKSTKGSDIFKVTVDNKDFFKGDKFVTFAKVDINRGKDANTEYVLYEKVATSESEQGMETQAVYIPTYKLGQRNFVVEYNADMARPESILEENNKYYYGDVSVISSSKAIQELLYTQEQFEDFNKEDINNLPECI